MSWRKEAVSLFKNTGFDLTIFVPEDRNGVWDESINFDHQIEWEEEVLRAVDCILFWIPRNLTTMPAFTTNIEFGAWKESGKVVLGYPPEAVKMDYLEYYAQKLQIPTSSTLPSTVQLACKKLVF